MGDQLSISFTCLGNKRDSNLRGTLQGSKWVAWGPNPTCPILPIGKVRGHSNPPSFPYACALQPLVHPRDDVTLPNIGIVGVVSGVAVIQGRGWGGSQRGLTPSKQFRVPLSLYPPTLGHPPDLESKRVPSIKVPL